MFRKPLLLGYPLANVNCDAATDAADLNSFVTAYSTGSGVADMDVNGQADAAA